MNVARDHGCAWQETLYRTSRMKAVARLLMVAALSIFASTIFDGCRAVSSAATTSYRVATAPVHFVGRKLSRHDPAAATTSTTRTTASDVTTPGHPLPSPSPTRPGRLIGTSSSVPSPTPSPKLAGTNTTHTKGKTSPRVASSTQSEFPTAKPVPGKPGYVFSPFDPKGRYVDVSGYTPGSKVKDPWTDKIFVVP